MEFLHYFVILSLIKVCTTAAPYPCVSDIVFAVDGSGSVNSVTWDLTIGFVKDFAPYVTFGPNLTRMGLLTFSSHAYIKAMLNQYQDVREFCTLVEETPYFEQSTNTSAAIRAARLEIFGKAGDRPEVSNFLILMTDGRLSYDKDEAIKEADLARLSDIAIIAIGVNAPGEQETLGLLTKDNNLVFMVDVSSNNHKIYQQLAAVVCKTDNANQEHSTGKSPVTSTHPPYAKAVIPGSLSSSRSSTLSTKPGLSEPFSPVPVVSPDGQDKTGKPRVSDKPSMTDANVINIIDYDKSTTHSSMPSGPLSAHPSLSSSPMTAHSSISPGVSTYSSILSSPVTAHTSLSSGPVTAHSFVPSDPVTAHASISPGVSAHSSISPGPVTTHSSIAAGLVTAHSSISPGVSMQSSILSSPVTAHTYLSSGPVTAHSFVPSDPVMAYTSISPDISAHSSVSPGPVTTHSSIAADLMTAHSSISPGVSAHSSMSTGKTEQLSVSSGPVTTHSPMPAGPVTTHSPIPAGSVTAHSSISPGVSTHASISSSPEAVHSPISPGVTQRSSMSFSHSRVTDQLANITLTSSGAGASAVDVVSTDIPQTGGKSTLSPESGITGPVSSIILVSRRGQDQTENPNITNKPDMIDSTQHTVNEELSNTTTIVSTIPVASSKGQEQSKRPDVTSQPIVTDSVINVTNEKKSSTTKLEISSVTGKASTTGEDKSSTIHSQSQPGIELNSTTTHPKLWSVTDKQFNGEHSTTTQNPHIPQGSSGTRVSAVNVVTSNLPDGKSTSPSGTEFDVASSKGQDQSKRPDVTSQPIVTDSVINVTDEKKSSTTKLEIASVTDKASTTSEDKSSTIHSQSQPGIELNSTTTHPKLWSITDKQFNGEHSTTTQNPHIPQGSSGTRVSAVNVVTSNLPDGKSTSPSGTEFDGQTSKGSSEDLGSLTTLPSEKPGYSGCRLDILFVLDGSGSVTEENFRKQLQATKAALRNFDVSPSGVNVALVTFSSEAYLQFSFKDTRYDSLVSIEKRIDMATWRDQRTNIGAVLKTAAKKVFSKLGGDRKFVDNVMILVTDSESNMGDIQRGDIRALRGVDARTFVITVNAKDAREARSIASEPVYFHLIQVLDYYEMYDVFVRLRDLVCAKDIPEPIYSLSEYTGSNIAILTSLAQDDPSLRGYLANQLRRYADELDGVSFFASLNGVTSDSKVDDALSMAECLKGTTLPQSTENVETVLKNALKLMKSNYQTVTRNIILAITDPKENDEINQIRRLQEIIHQAKEDRILVFVVIKGSVTPTVLLHARFSKYYNEFERAPEIIPVLFVTHFAPIVFNCSFENEGEPYFCGMTQASDDQFDWRLHTGGTSSRHTGPRQAYAGVYYAYIEASSPRQPGDMATLIFPELSKYSGTFVCVQFSYHMSGYHTGTLLISTAMDSGKERKIFWMLSGHQGKDWFSAEVTVLLRKELRISAIRGGEFSSDIAIDDVIVRKGPCAMTPP